MLDGRVKTLHPSVHGGILARRDQKHHMEALNEHGIGTVIEITDSSTSNLWSPLKAHKNRDEQTANSQISGFVFDSAVYRKSVVSYVVKRNQPLGYSDDPHYVKHVRESLNPNFQPVSRTTLITDVFKMYEEKKMELIASMLDSPNHNVAFTSDIWSSPSHFDYLSVVAHYVDRNWVLRKRIIGFEHIETHTGMEIADKLMDVLGEFHLVGRTISVTFDNHAANKTAVTELLKKFSPTAGEYLIHQRCAAHIINLMVQAGLEKLGPVIAEISGCVRYCFGQSLRLGRWLRYCESRGVEGRIIGADSEHRWNTTYIMLDRLLPYSELFQAWFNNDFGENRLTERHWVVARMVHNFFHVFFETTTCLSSSSHPTSTLAMHKLHEIAQVFEAHFNHPELNETIQAMLVVFRKYFFPMPVLYSFAFILDPRIKTWGLKEFLRFIQNGTGIPYEATFEEAHVIVYHVYGMYENKYKPGLATDDMFTHSPVKRSWDKFNDRLKAIAGKSKTSASASASASNNDDNELTSYLNTKFRNLSRDNLDVLNWWRIHESEYPILSIMARDILTIPVTSVSSEEAFSTAENMLDPSRNRLTPRLVKAMTCLKDWELAATNEQPSPSEAHDKLVSDMSYWQLNNI